MLLVNIEREIFCLPVLFQLQSLEVEAINGSLAGYFKGEIKKSNVVLEAISNGALLIWHYFFGSHESPHDINMINRCTTTGLTIAGAFLHDIKFLVNGKEYCFQYFLTNQIYLNWRIAVRKNTTIDTEEQRSFGAAKVAVRDDVERALGFLVVRLHLMSNGDRMWYRQVIVSFMKAGVFIHDIVKETGQDKYGVWWCFRCTTITRRFSRSRNLNGLHAKEWRRKLEFC